MNGWHVINLFNPAECTSVLSNTPQICSVQCFAFLSYHSTDLDPHVLALDKVQISEKKSERENGEMDTNLK